MKFLAHVEGEDDEYASEKLRYVSQSKTLWTTTRLSKRRRTEWSEVDYRWICGPSGVGKTHEIYEEFEFDDIYEKNGENKWWDGYEGQQCIILDDYRPTKELSYAYLLRLFDVYPLQGEVKGSSLQIQASSSCIVVTCNKWPWELWPEEIDPRAQQPGDNYTPLVRRVELIEVDSLGNRYPIKKPDLSLPRVNNSE